MPLYNFKCEQCFHLEVDVLVKDEKTEYRCPKCGGFMIRQFPLSNFYLKGEGWANTGYQKKIKKEPPQKSD